MGNRSRLGKRERQMANDKNRNGGNRINPANRNGSQSYADAKKNRTNQV